MRIASAEVVLNIRREFQYHSVPIFKPGPFKKDKLISRLRYFKNNSEQLPIDAEVETQIFVKRHL